MKYSNVKLYTAGPFFSRLQRSHYEAVVKSIEKYCTTYSVIRDGIICPPTADADTQEKAFSINAQRIEECSGMVAILDYLGVELYTRIDKSKVKNTDSKILIDDSKSYQGQTLEDAIEDADYVKKINIADSGTLWECGASYMAHKPVVGLMLGNQNLNLMLARGMVSIARSFNELDEILKKLVPALSNESILPEVLIELRTKMWSGEII